MAVVAAARNAAHGGRKTEPESAGAARGGWQAGSVRYLERPELRLRAATCPGGTEPPMLPWAAELYKHRVDTLGYDSADDVLHAARRTRCDARWLAIRSRSSRRRASSFVLFEEFHKYRQIHTDGRKLPVDPDPAWYGYSVGRWEGDTFVVETAGFKEGSWLDNQRPSAYRRAAHDRALPPGRFRLAWSSRSPSTTRRRTRGPWTSDTIALHPAARHGAARASL